MHSIFNLITLLLTFQLLSIGLILVGILGIAIREDELNINSKLEFFTDPAAIIIAVAAVVFLITFFGCVGALNENCLFLRIVSYLCVPEESSQSIGYH